jgi:hypothetical protein
VGSASIESSRSLLAKDDLRKWDGPRGHARIADVLAGHRGARSSMNLPVRERSTASPRLRRARRTEVDVEEAARETPRWAESARAGVMRPNGPEDDVRLDRSIWPSPRAGAARRLTRTDAIGRGGSRRAGMLTSTHSRVLVSVVGLPCPAPSPRWAGCHRARRPAALHRGSHTEQGARAAALGRRWR